MKDLKDDVGLDCPRSVLFVIGRTLRGQIDEANRTLFNKPKLTREIDTAVRAFDFYKRQIDLCKKAVETWLLVGIRFGVVKDIRRLIGIMIWESRNDANY